MKIWLTSQSWACIYCSKFSKSNLWQARGDVVWCGVVTRFAAETGHDKLKQVCTLLLCHGLSRNSTKSRTNKASTILSLFFFLSLSLSFSLSLTQMSHILTKHVHSLSLSLSSLFFLSLLYLCLSFTLRLLLSFPFFLSPYGNFAWFSTLSLMQLFLSCLVNKSANQC